MFPLCTSTEELEDQSPSVPHDEPQEPHQVLTSDLDAQGSRTYAQNERKSWNGLTLVVNDIETRNSTSPTPKSPVGSPLSIIFNTSRLSLVPSREKKDNEAKRLSRTDERLLNASRENLASPIPIRRASLRQPGIATRVNRDERWGPSPPGEAGVDVDRDYYYNPVFPEEASPNKVEAFTSQAAKAFKPVPPPLIRTETPSDLVFLGGLKLGSLHITNGRASPTPSDLSKTARSKSTPNLRNASDEYGESPAGDGHGKLRSVPSDGSPKQSNMPKVHSRAASPAPPHQSPLRLSSNTKGIKASAMKDITVHNFEERRRPAKIDTGRKSPDINTFMAEDYMAELPASPFGDASPQSTSGSILKTTTKPNECDDRLFEDESLPSDSDSADDSTLDTFYSSNGVTTAEEKQESSLQKLRPAYTLADSGYSSTSSLRAARKEVGQENVTEEVPPNNSPRAVPNTAYNEPTTLKSSQDRRPGPHPLRPSILKQVGATTVSLPTFGNLHHSSATISTVMTANSAPTLPKSRKLTKLRLLSRSSSKEIIVQGNNHDLMSPVPPIPPEFLENLAIRCQEVPELQNTYETRQHTAESPTTSNVSPVEIRFPSPAASINESDHKAIAPRRLQSQRVSIFHRRSKSDKATSGQRASHDMTEADALATIRDFGTVGHSLGGNPYDMAQISSPPGRQRDVEPARTVNPHSITNAGRRPKATGGMDAETAAELARMRSRTIQERDSMAFAERRNLKFNDRGGVPGKNLRPSSLAVATPPIPSLPGSFGTSQKQSWAPQSTCQPLHEQHGGMVEHDQAIYDHKSHVQPIIDQSGYSDWDEQPSTHGRSYWEDYQIDSYYTGDDNRQSWRSDRVEIDFDPRQNWAPNDDYPEYNERHNCNSSQGEIPLNGPSEDSSYYYDNNGPRQVTQAESNGPFLWNGHEAEEHTAPPPPHHLPRPTNITPLARQDDTWEIQVKAWETRRQTACQALRQADNSRILWEPNSLDSVVPPGPAAPYLPFDNGYAVASNSYIQHMNNDNLPPPNSYGSYHGRGNSWHPSRQVTQQSYVQLCRLAG